MMAEIYTGGESEPELDEAEIKRRFEEKKRLLEQAGISKEVKSVFREAFRDAVVERAKIAPPAPKPTDHSLDGASQKKADRAVKAELDRLVEIALVKGVKEAFAIAMAETPYLIDALHDELADHYYQKLAEAGMAG